MKRKKKTELEKRVEREERLVNKVNKMHPERLEKRIHWLKRKWEFMRRSEEYRKAYETVIEIRERAGGKDDEPPKKYSSTPEYNEEKIIVKKYFNRNMGLFNPEQSFDELLATFKGDSVGGKLMRLEMNLKSSFKFRTVLSEDGTRELGREFVIRIDLDGINSISALIEELDFNLRMAWLSYLRAHPEKKERSKQDYDCMERILRAGDLSREGIKAEQIAKEIFAETFETSSESPIRKTREYIKIYEAAMEFHRCR